MLVQTELRLALQLVNFFWVSFEEGRSLIKDLIHPKKHSNLLHSLYTPLQNIAGNNHLTESLTNELGLLK